MKPSIRNSWLYLYIYRTAHHVFITMCCKYLAIKRKRNAEPLACIYRQKSYTRALKLFWKHLGREAESDIKQSAACEPEVTRVSGFYFSLTVR